MSQATVFSERTPVRLLALGAALLVVGSFVGVLYHVVDVISDPGHFLVIVSLTLLGATLLARYLTVRWAMAIGASLFVVGLGWYLTLLDNVSLWLWPHLRYTLSLITGRSVLQIVNLEAWVLAVTPAPVFLSWYFAVQRRYVQSAIVSGSTTLFFVLTGDASGELTLLGVVGVVALVGVGELDSVGGRLGDADVVATIVALIIVTSATITIVPAGAGYTFSPDTGLDSPRGSGAGGDADTLEGSLLGADEQLSIVGSLNLSSEVRYRVESTAAEYWRVGAFDLYTGDGWVRRGNTGSLEGRLGSPAGRTRTVEQAYRPLRNTSAMPAVWRPGNVSGEAADLARVGALGGLTPTRTLGPEDTYRVRSAVPVATQAELREVTTEADYPESIIDRYTQLPDNTPDRVAERTARLTANAENVYDTARVIEHWLETNREYSLNVSKPSGNIADAFLFEMDRGYCTYYATTMTAMLRTQGIPARMVVGYSTGQRVSESEWVVRGNNAHAWVEVFFPEVGWVRFDPTPAGPREETAEQDLEAARQGDVPNVDTEDSESGEWTPTPETPETDTEDNGTTENGTGPFTPERRGETQPVDAELTPPDGSQTDGGEAENESAAEGGGTVLRLPSAEQTALGTLVLLGVAGMARRTGLSRWGYRAIWVRHQRRRDPETDIEGAYERLLYVLERRHRPRRPGETVRTYLDAIGADRRARRVATIRERARYAGTVEQSAADDAVRLVDEIVSK